MVRGCVWCPCGFCKGRVEMLEDCLLTLPFRYRYRFMPCINGKLCRQGCQRSIVVHRSNDRVV